ncbi:hypothetical protein BO71DRAFT_147193 [Aspergillus ellipticus CBS 707.79]|uniref:Ketoreductase (KR) domain-containing protein n=1 Tax=Aspergillus ellipticus CBS 707.79 TaxID=1448320 RepID=A0A319CSA5_9EURO|nr:hypothetical protein BO71DRAFT_147193 [Aspergillus ellipticus CBS 707.79]
MGGQILTRSSHHVRGCYIRIRCIPGGCDVNNTTSRDMDKILKNRQRNCRTRSAVSARLSVNDMISSLRLIFFLYTIFRSLLNILQHRVLVQDLPDNMAPTVHFKDSNEETKNKTNFSKSTRTQPTEREIKWIPDAQHKIQLQPNTAYVIIGKPEGIASRLCPSILNWGGGALVFLSKERNTSPEGTQVLNDLRNAGAKVQVYTDCLSRASRLSTVLSLWNTDGWRIGGIIHDRTKHIVRLHPINKESTNPTRPPTPSPYSPTSPRPRSCTRSPLPCSWTSS